MPSILKPPQTLYDKVFQDHVVDEKEDGTVLLYIGETVAIPIMKHLTKLHTDRHLVHEVTSPVSSIPIQVIDIWGLNKPSKLSKAFVTRIEKLGDRTVLLRPQTTYVSMSNSGALC